MKKSQKAYMNDGFKVYKTFLGADQIIIANVANFDSMPPLSSLCLMPPIKIKDGSQAPVRLVGLIKKL